MHKGIAVSPGVVVGVAYRVDSVFGSSDPQPLADPALVPEEIEFWQGQVGRLHDRFRYARGDDGWTIERLAP